MKRVAFYTLGCKVNQYESEAMLEAFEAAGYQQVDFSAPADLYIINTCSVTALADKKSRQAIRKAKHTNPSAMVIVTGCYAQTNPKEVAKIDGVDLVVGNHEKKDLVQLLQQTSAPMCVVSDIFAQRSFLEMPVHAHQGKTRAFMKIQEGCNNFCSYCIIPYARGPIRSRTLEHIMEEARVLTENGYQEIVLVGIHLASYGADLQGPDLCDVLLKLHQIPGLKRIRLGSLELTPVLEKIAAHASSLPKLCDHFHISLQSGCDETLARMRRRYDSAAYRRAIHQIKAAWPHAAITTDVMVGFAGETEEEFQKSYEFVRSISFAKVHVFPYSIRPGTAAASLKGSCRMKSKSSAQRLCRLWQTKWSKLFTKGLSGKRFAFCLNKNALSQSLRGAHHQLYRRLRLGQPGSAPYHSGCKDSFLQRRAALWRACNCRNFAYNKIKTTAAGHLMRTDSSLSSPNLFEALPSIRISKTGPFWISQKCPNGKQNSLFTFFHCRAIIKSSYRLR